MWEGSACLYVEILHAFVVAAKTIRGNWSPGTELYGWLWAAMSVLGTKPKSTAKTVSALKKVRHLSISSGNFWYTRVETASHQKQASIWF